MILMFTEATMTFYVHRGSDDTLRSQRQRRHFMFTEATMTCYVHGDKDGTLFAN